METVIGTIAGILTSVSMIPRLIKVLKEKDVENLSWGMIAVYSQVFRCGWFTES